MSKYIDITLPVQDSVACWPGDPPLAFGALQRISRGDVCNVTTMSSTVHFGTHIDAPRHYVDDGDTISDLDLNLLIGECYVLDCSDRPRDITAEDIAAVPASCKRLLVRTYNTVLRYLHAPDFKADFYGFTVDGARALVERGIRLVGLDYFSFGCLRETQSVHTAYLSAKGAIAIEAVDLECVSQGWYKLTCLPLRLVGCDGAPCRCILEKIDER